MVSRVDGFVDEQRSMIFVWASGMVDVGRFLFGLKGGVVPFLIIYYQGPIHMGGQEEVLGTR